MKLKLTTNDPLNILTSTKNIVENAESVTLHLQNITTLAKKVRERIQQGFDTPQQSFGATGNLKDDAQLIFLEDVLNFCFWPDKGKPKWQIEWPSGKYIDGGWYGLVGCFERAMMENPDILDAEYLSTISLREVKNIFRSANKTEVPLLTERMNNLQEAGTVLMQKFDGQFFNVLEQSTYDAVELVKSVYTNFSSFRDVSTLNGKTVMLLKRAQIVACDINYITKKPLKRIEELTAFADYKLPQMLRMFGMIEYSPELANRIDTQILIPHDSREEVEIRAATIWGVELLRQHLKIYTAAQIDNAVWLLSQNLQNTAQPYHRTRTIFY